jgi:ribosomal protein S18 acetylase RimI-like enzyme
MDFVKSFSLVWKEIYKVPPLREKVLAKMGLDSQMKKIYIKQCTTDEYMRLQDISIDNNIKNGGNLKYTFFQMLDLLTFEHNIEPYVIKCYDAYGYCGYCIFYFHGNIIQISQICLKKNYQNKGLAKLILDEFKQGDGIDIITADISINNEQSQRFFYKNDFILRYNQEKIQAIWHR